MHSANPGRAILGGFVATIVMTMIIYAAPMMGMPAMDIAGMLGSMMSGSMAAPGSGAWWMGMFAHFMLGSVVFALIYAYLAYPILPGANWLRGVMWGTVLWFMMQVAVMPMMGKGVFSGNTPAPAMMVVATLVVHWIYGAILGSVARQQVTREAFHGRERHA